MKIFFTLLIAAALFASCSEPTVKIAEPTQYNITFKVYCDSCEGAYGIDLYSSPAIEIEDFFTFDTIAYSGSTVVSGFFDSSPNIGTYRASVYINGVLSADTLINNTDASTFFLEGSVGFTLD